MSCSYVCAACRRRLLQRIHSVESKHIRSASFVTLKLPHPPTNPDGDFISEVDKVADNDASREPRSIPEQQPLRSVENDFLERLLAGRERSDVQGPYSKPPKKKARDENTSKIRERTGQLKAVGISRGEHLPVPGASMTVNPVIHNSPSTYPLVNLPSQLLPTDFSLRGVRYHSIGQDAVPSQKVPMRTINNSPSSALTTSPAPGSGPNTTVLVNRARSLFAIQVANTGEKTLQSDLSSKNKRSARAVLATSSWNDVEDVQISLRRNIVPSQAFPQEVSPSTSSPNATPVTKNATPASALLASGQERKLSKGRSFIRNGTGLAASANEKSHSSVSASDSAKIRTTHGLDRNEDGNWNNFFRLLELPPPENGIKSGVGSSSSRALRDNISHSAISASDAEKIILDSKTPLVKAWQMYLELQRQNSFGRVSLKIRPALFKRIVLSWCTGQDTELQLTPSLALQHFRHNSLVPLDIQSWTNAVWAVIVRAIENLRSENSQTTQPSTRSLTQELMHLWNICMRRTASRQVTTEQSRNKTKPTLSWNILAESDQMKQIRTWFSKDFSARLLHFFPSVQTSPVANHFDSAALITFIIIRARCLALGDDDAEFKNYQPFLGFISHLLPYSNFLSQSDRYAEAMGSHGSSQLDKAYVLSALSELSLNTVSLPITHGLPLPASTPTATEQLEAATPQHLLEEQLRKRIGRAIESQNVPRLETLWREIQSAYSNNPLDVARTPIPITVYRQMLTAFMSLQRPNRAVDVWNSMVHEGIEPTVHAWNAMLKGCGIARDIPAINDIWSKMMKSGIKPDVQAWATRIHCLAAAGDWQSGIQAFREMTTTWTDSIKLTYNNKSLPDLATLGDTDLVPKPNTQVLNGLVAGLARYRRHNELVKVLGLARSLGIIADIYTFNPLFRSAIQAGNPALAVKLLAQMQSLGISPDVATFTMILHSLFSKDDTPSASPGDADNGITSEQIAANILQQMEHCGLQANAWTFATLINGLLKGPSGGNIQAAYAVLSYMSANDIALSSQIYTALLTYHFDQKPNADIGAVETLLNRARTDTRVFLDVFFFDRLIEGFAKSGEIGRMTAALAQAGKRGKVPGWPAMTEVVKALAAAGDWTRLAEIMGTVREELQSKDEVRTGKGKREFMRIAGEMGYNEHLEHVDNPMDLAELSDRNVGENASYA